MKILLIGLGAIVGAYLGFVVGIAVMVQKPATTSNFSLCEGLLSGGLTINDKGDRNECN